MDKTDYEAAWHEGEQNAPAENAVAAAKKKAYLDEKGEYITAYSDLDGVKSEEDQKKAKAKAEKKD